MGIDDPEQDSPPPKAVERSAGWSGTVNPSSAHELEVGPGPDGQGSQPRLIRARTMIPATIANPSTVFAV